MKILLFAIVTFFSSFNPESETKWICHSIVQSPFKQTCLVKIIDANSRDEAELKFDIYISDMEKELGMKQRDKTTYAVSPLAKGIKIEHELKGF